MFYGCGGGGGATGGDTGGTTTTSTSTTTSSTIDTTATTTSTTTSTSTTIAINPALHANAGSDITGLSTGFSVSLDGSKSSKDGGGVFAFKWSFVTIPPASSLGVTLASTSHPSFVPDVKGAYEVKLVLTDDTGESTPDNVLVTVDNTRPAANAGNDIADASPASLITLAGSGSDADSNSLTYKWSYVEQNFTLSFGTTVAQPTVRLPNVRPERYTFRLIVNDGTVDSAPDDVIIDVN
ncbi:MAG: hypothetical protein HZA20_07205 [Nitrospirae bacterium]|nr:hypothetical protein [Nitrospirota bacterium]